MTLAQSNEHASLAETVNRSLSVSLMPKDVTSAPSPHFYQTHAFDDDLFNQFRNQLPATDFYGGMGRRTSNPRAQKARVTFPLVKENLQGLPSEQQDFWAVMIAYFRSADFVRLALAAYSPFFEKLRPDLINHQNFEIRYELLRDTTAYGIGPHSDNPKKVMTLLFYLSSDGENDSLGTSFYVPKQEGFTCDSGRHHKYEDFNLVTTYPYAPNAVLSFLRTNTSFHGVEVIEEENVQRDIMRWMLWKN